MNKETDNAAQPRLFPCPFCGFSKISYSVISARHVCTTCGAWGPSKIGQQEPMELNWNTRSSKEIK